LAPQVTDPPKQLLPRITQPFPDAHVGTRFTKAGIFSLLILIGLLLLFFSGQLVVSLFQSFNSQVKPVTTTTHATSIPKTKHSTIVTPTPTQDIDATSPIFAPGNATLPPLQLPDGYYVIYEQTNGLYIVSDSGSVSKKIPADGYVYSEAVPPILTPSGQLLYSGNGIWLIDPFGGTPTQIATLTPGQVITSMTLSNDGTMIAWSTENTDGTGNIAIHAGPLATPIVVYEQPALNCPCFRIYSFARGTGSEADTTLLLTDDRGSSEAVQYGLWSLDLTHIPAIPQLILDENPQQGPLALTPNGNGLLYSSNEGAVPVPTDSSVPTSIAALSYANDLNLTALSDASQMSHASQVVLANQDNLSNSAQYHWITTPVFSPDGHTLAYIEFSSDSQDPYDRHSALYTAQISGSGSQIHASKPRLIATSTELLMELGPWFNNHIITFYSDGSLYAMDVQTNALTALIQTGQYASIVAITGSPRPSVG
jgi:WD40-like Beta Propeller Repeat